jgi:hypothetical protein
MRAIMCSASETVSSRLCKELQIVKAAVHGMQRHLPARHSLVVVHVLVPVHVAVREPVYPLPHVPVQVPCNGVGLGQPLNVP